MTFLSIKRPRLCHLSSESLPILYSPLLPIVCSSNIISRSSLNGLMNFIDMNNTALKA